MRYAGCMWWDAVSCKLCHLQFSWADLCCLGREGSGGLPLPFSRPQRQDLLAELSVMCAEGHRLQSSLEILEHEFRRSDQEMTGNGTEYSRRLSCH